MSMIMTAHNQCCNFQCTNIWHHSSPKPKPVDLENKDKARSQGQDQPILSPSCRGRWTQSSRTSSPQGLHAWSKQWQHHRPWMPWWNEQTGWRKSAAQESVHFHRSTRQHQHTTPDNNHNSLVTTTANDHNSSITTTTTTPRTKQTKHPTTYKPNPQKYLYPTYFPVDDYTNYSSYEMKITISDTDPM